MPGTSPLPTGEDVQKFFSDYGMAPAPGEEPDDLVSRIYETIGSSLLPAGIMAKARIAASIPSELAAATGAATGGKALESTVKVARENGVFLAGLAIAVEQYGHALEELTEEAQRGGFGIVH